jgi:ribosomal protein S18 acetylase RimI-like enzyme
MLYKPYAFIIASLFMGLHYHVYANHDFLKGIIAMKNGTFVTHDIYNSPIVLEWEEIAGNTERLAEKIKQSADILVPAYTNTEVDFARKRPDLVANDFMLKSVAPLLAHNIQTVDWALFEEKTRDLLAQFFATTDWVKYSNSQDINIFVTAIDEQTGDRLGVIQFLISSEFGPHTIKAALYGVIQSVQGRNVEQLLMCSIFRIRPDVKRIFLHTRSTNEAAVAQYKDWGFAEFVGKLPHWTDLEYITERSETLQKVAGSLVAQ